MITTLEEATAVPAVCVDPNCSWPGAIFIGPIAALPAEVVDMAELKKFLPVDMEFLKSS